MRRPFGSYLLELLPVPHQPIIECNDDSSITPKEQQSMTKANHFSSTNCQLKLSSVLLLPLFSPGDRLNIELLSYQHKNSRCKDKTVLRSSFLLGKSPYPERRSLYWDRSLARNINHQIILLVLPPIQSVRSKLIMTAIAFAPSIGNSPAAVGYPKWRR